jgi:hypothetical protein
MSHISLADRSVQRKRRSLPLPREYSKQLATKAAGCKKEREKKSDIYVSCFEVLVNSNRDLSNL